MATSHHYLFDNSIHMVVALVLFLGTVYGQDPFVVTVVATGWSIPLPESKSSFVCPANQVMIGRTHSGDANGPTRYQCGVVQNDGHIFEVPGATAQWSDWCVKESKCTFMCPQGRVMTGRQHSGNGNGKTRYQCAEVHHNGLTIKYQSLQWSPGIMESNSRFDCPSNTVMVGRTHQGDVNGATSYQCATFLPYYQATPIIQKYSGETTGCQWQYQISEGTFKCPPFVFYLSPALRSPLALKVNKAGKFLVNSFTGRKFTTSPNAIFTMGVFGDIYASNSFPTFMFHHSSFFAGNPVAAAGQMQVDQGIIKRIDSCSGHYRPSDRIAMQAVDALTKQGYPGKAIRFVSCGRIGDVLFDYMRAHKIQPVELSFSKLHAMYLGPGNTKLCYNTTEQESCRRPMSVKVPRRTTVELCFEGDKCRFFRQGVHQVKGGIVKQALVKAYRKQRE